jgi:hypothetical protein
MATATLARINGYARPADGSSAGNAQITGRTLTHYTVTSPGSYVYPGTWNAVDSDFEKVVRAIAQVGSIELLGAPQSGNVFHVAISGAAPAATSGTASLQGYCNTAVNGSGVSGTTVAAFVY